MIWVPWHICSTTHIQQHDTYRSKIFAHPHAGFIHCWKNKAKVAEGRNTECRNAEIQKC